MVLVQVDLTDINRLIPYERNPRFNEAGVDKVAASIAQFGFRQPIVVDPSMVVIVGHTRLLAAKKLGFREVPVHIATGLSAAQARAYRLADNRLHEDSTWDVAGLKLELADLQLEKFDLSETGFTAEELAELLGIEEPDKDPNEAPPVDRLVRSCDGDVWICGPHRAVCGDATSREAVKLATGGALVDIVWTDPPYNVAYKGGTEEALTIKNDKMADADFSVFLSTAFTAAASVMKPGAAIYVAHADTEGLSFRAAFIAAGLKLSGCLIWRKNSLVLGRSDYQWQHEPILYGWKPGSPHRWFGGRKQTTIADLPIGEPFVPMPDGRWQVQVGDRTLIVSADAVVEERPNSVLSHDRPKRNGEHPTMKPVELIERMLKNNARAGDLVFDSFGGSGSTLMAAERLGMSSVLLELDPRYFDVIVKRWEEYTGRRAVREADGVEFGSIEPRPHTDG